MTEHIVNCPAEIGQVIYYINRNYDYETNKYVFNIEEFEVENIELSIFVTEKEEHNFTKITLVGEDICISSSDAFLTKEEAEKFVASFSRDGRGGVTDTYTFHKTLRSRTIPYNYPIKYELKGAPGEQRWTVYKGRSVNHCKEMIIKSININFIVSVEGINVSGITYKLETLTNRTVLSYGKEKVFDNEAEAKAAWYEEQKIAFASLKVEAKNKIAFAEEALDKAREGLHDIEKSELDLYQKIELREAGLIK